MCQLCWMHQTFAILSVIQSNFYETADVSAVTEVVHIPFELCNSLVVNLDMDVVPIIELVVTVSLVTEDLSSGCLVTVANTEATI